MPFLKGFVTGFSQIAIFVTFCYSILHLGYNGITTSADLMLVLLLLVIGLNAVKTTGDSNGKDSSKESTLS